MRREPLGECYFVSSSNGVATWEKANPHECAACGWAGCEVYYFLRHAWRAHGLIEIERRRVSPLKKRE